VKSSHKTAVLVVAFGSICLMTGWAVAQVQRQPHMEAALASLQSAHASLQRASADKGGHRLRAMNFVNSAIAEVRAGIAYDNTR